MSESMWDVPQTPEGMATAIERLKQVREEGNLIEEGNGLLALAHLVKWVAFDNEQDPFTRSNRLAVEALAVFRMAGDDRGQVRALVSALPMADRSDRDAMLEEAESIARSTSDENLVAMVISGRARHIAMSDRAEASRLYREAIDIYRRTGNKSGLAGCLFGLSIGDDPAISKVEYALEAADLYRQMGDSANSGRCMWIALMNAEEFKPMAELGGFAAQGLKDAQASGDRGMEGHYYGKLALIAAAKGEVDESAKYRRWATEIEESDGLTPKERWQANVEKTKMMVSMAKQQGHEEAAKVFAEELKRLKSEKP
jgi:tetratricopeptide (TPR) repeat protein